MGRRKNIGESGIIGAWTRSGNALLPQYRTDRTWGKSEHQHVSFGVRDHKGREIGARVTRRADTFTELTGEIEGRSYHNIRPGTWFVFVPQATRDGASYGASQPDQFYETEAAREAAIELYLAGARVRVAKLARIG